MIDMNHYDRPFILDLDLSSLDYQILALNPSLRESYDSSSHDSAKSHRYSRTRKNVRNH